MTFKCCHVNFLLQPPASDCLPACPSPPPGSYIQPPTRQSPSSDCLPAPLKVIQLCNWSVGKAKKETKRGCKNCHRVANFALKKQTKSLESGLSVSYLTDSAPTQIRTTAHKCIGLKSHRCAIGFYYLQYYHGNLDICCPLIPRYG